MKEKDAKELVKREKKSIEVLINEAAKEMQSVLPLHLRAERLIIIARQLIINNPKLTECTPESFIGSLMLCAQTGLEPIGGKAYIIPYFNSKMQTMEAQFQVGYKGLIDLFYRHNKAIYLDAQEVKEKDEFDYEYGSNPFLRHKPALGDRGESISYYAIANINGQIVFKVMSREEIMKHGLHYSKQVDRKTNTFLPNSVWSTDFDAMAKKTVIIQLSKVLPTSIEIQQVIEADQTTRLYKTGIKNAFELPITSRAIEVEAEEPIIETKEPEPIKEPKVEKVEPKWAESKPDKNKQTKLRFLEDLIKAKGLWNRINQDYNSLSIDEKIKILEELKKEKQDDLF